MIEEENSLEEEEKANRTVNVQSLHLTFFIISLIQMIVAEQMFVDVLKMDIFHFLHTLISLLFSSPSALKSPGCLTADKQH